jgi:hypothetical protein
MIQFTLKCDQDHRFDSWFQSGAAFDKLKAAGMVTCSVCGSASVEKAIMAPRVRPARSAAVAPVDAQMDTPAPGPAPPAPTAPLSAPQNQAEEALSELRRNIEENSEYVGDKFTQEARAMHEGDSPERAIYGEAKLDDAKELIEDGIPVLPLPFMPGRKTN